VSCALSVLGAFFLVVKLSSLLSLEVVWLPYAAHVLGASLAGAAMVGATPASWRDAALGGALAIVVLAFVSFGVPHAFLWIPARTSAPALVVGAILIASSVCAGAGARLASMRPPPSTAAVVFLATTITACVTMLGGRVVYVLGVPALDGPQLIVASVAAFASALLAQWVVPVRRVAACAIGIPALTAIHLAVTVHDGHPVDLTLLGLVVPWGVAVLGAHLALRRAGAGVALGS
jgi:hypothetical protein